MTSAPTETLTTKQLAEHLNRPRSTVSWWLRLGRITGAYKDGHAWRIPIEHAREPDIPREPTYPPLT